MKAKLLKTLSVLFFVLAFTAVSFAQDNKDDKQPKDAPVKIKSKPAVKSGNCSGNVVTVVLRATFDKSAKITDVVIFKSSGCDSFDKEAIKAAKGIKFKPAVKNGEPYSVTKSLVYTFTKNER